MDPAHRALLRTHRLELSGQLLVSETIVPVLYQENVLTEAQVEDIASQPTDRLKTLKLLDLLPSRGPRAFSAFLRSLDEFGWVRDKLLQELQTGPGPSSPGETREEEARLRPPASHLEVETGLSVFCVKALEPGLAPVQSRFWFCLCGSGLIPGQ